MPKQIQGRIGLIGDPVEHSLSPAFQQAAFDALNIPVTYELWHTPADLISQRLDQLRSGDIYGANVTVPHKEAFFEAVDRATPLAGRARAVNTLYHQDGQLWGDNTDIHGFLVPLRERSIAFGNATATVLGAGGAARGIVVALLDAGIGRCVVLNRTLERAHRLAEELDDSRLETAEIDRATELAANTDLLVNATAVGWGDGLPVDEGAFRELPAHAIAYDLTYRDTPFLQAAREHGLGTIDGLPMLVHQGARSFEIWTGESAPVEVMWSAAVEARRNRRD